ncbi:MAG TPA: ACT domain-containing protein [Methanothermobacter sp.]|uniref:MBL fold hydrolase n=1 Tax=Methanothermobacter tenebrarum TaxID=680118 RepID=A0ABM7YDU4_9EURY|nr:ACT domain-containing protein [Methanothermobacter tenebrarum]MDD3454146.1 ACT domain-containing protein [Methanobacteriales archaeon]MDX9693152.1 ACT domain-containing protein [Methanothermobacter sp.]BDH79589.1 MBL fold hydrolase [Methanothermobacter tenebrarum]HHW15851.1 ACT domain-containing protein [Methanothermobacter sp.]
MGEFEAWTSDDGLFLYRLRVYVPDRPGSLARIAGYFADHGVNISYFYYNRSEHPNRVIVEGKSRVDVLHYDDLVQEGFFRELFEENLEIMKLDNILKVSVYLENKPGTLADFARVLGEYGVNVTYMAYNELISENKAEMAFYVKDSKQIQELARKLNELGYHYNLEYTGADEEKTNMMIGLNLIERFFLKLRELLDDEEVNKVKELVNTSKRLSDTLIGFNREAGRNLEAGQVLGNILAFAISSRNRVGERFHYRRLPSLPLGKVLLHVFKPPTGGNIYLLEADELVMIDGTYGIYYNDVKKMLKENNIDPSQITRIYLSHADADHAGLSGYFYEEYGTRVFMHPEAKDIIRLENRAAGSKTPLMELNHYFTILVNHFTECKFPKDWQPYKTKKKAKIGAFPTIDQFSVGDLEFKVLESLGGHVPGQVFFLSEEAGVLFSGDYLLYVPSLGDEEKKFLNIPRFLMTSTNANSMLFKEEMEALKEVGEGIDRNGLIVLPGHGDYYPIRLIL